MREFKFRAWDIEDKEMFLPETEYNSETFFTGIESGKLLCQDLEADDPNNRYILMQYIDYKDKNNKEIYGGDIIRHWYEELFFEGNVRGYIEWNKADVSFHIVYKSASISLSGIDMDYAKLEVIGNIYENPELLEEEVEG